VIIREQVAPAVVALQPRDVPFPFTSIRDYETFIRQPLGADWNTPLAQQALIQPAVVTKVGSWKFGKSNKKSLKNTSKPPKKGIISKIINCK
jgi:TRAP-type C4-dicarboxylate transport system substrate-binding protein